MVALNRIFAFDPNFVVPVSADFTEQTRIAWFRIHEGIRGGVGVDLNGTASSAGAWTVATSSPGDGTFGAGNNILNTADIVHAAGGTNHTWGDYTPPAALIPTKTPHLVIDFNDGSDPRSTATIVIMPSAPTTPGTATARPSHTSELVFSAQEFFNSVTTNVARRTHLWRTSIGELMFQHCRDGANEAQSEIWVVRPDGGEAGLIWPLGLWYSGGPPSVAQLQNTSLWKAFWQDDTSVVFSPDSNVFLWTAALAGKSNVSNAAPDFPMATKFNSASKCGFPGVIVDWRASVPSLPVGDIQNNDTDLVRRLCTGGKWSPYRFAGGALVY